MAKFELNSLGFGVNGAAIPGADAMMALTDQLLTGWNAINDEVITFAKAQTEANLKLMRSLAGCSSPAEAVSLQLDCAQGTLNRCIGVASKTSDLASKLASESLASLKPTADALAGTTARR